jgi:2-oxoglutarate dehydrogenase E1 component
VGRVELLYPIPREELAELLSRYPELETVVWAQEEPWNMGARKFEVPELERLLPEGVPPESVARPERSSPAEGYLRSHRAEQRRILAEAMGG